MIPSYLITYDLSEKRDYTEIISAIKSIANGYSSPLESVWIIGHNGPAANIRDILKKHIDSDDKLLVVKLIGEGAWSNLGETKSEWLKQNL